MSVCSNPEGKSPNNVCSVFSTAPNYNTPMPEERRKLKFTSIDDITTDAGKLAQAERNKKLRQLGNWTLGQACGHIAAWIDYGFDGTPAKFSWFVRMLAQQAKKIYPGTVEPRRKASPHPGRNPRDRPLDHRRWTQSPQTPPSARLKASTPTRTHFIFGRLKPDEWKNIHMRHAELHLSFLRPD